MLRLIVPGSLVGFSSSSMFLSVDAITYHVMVIIRKRLVSVKLRYEIEEGMLGRSYRRSTVGQGLGQVHTSASTANWMRLPPEDARILKSWRTVQG